MEVAVNAIVQRNKKAFLPFFRGHPGKIPSPGRGSLWSMGVS
jgi:hypothetical protein